MADSKRKRQADDVPAGDLIWAKLEAALGPQAADTRPPDSVTVEEFAARRGICVSRASAVLRKLAQDGVLRCVPFRGPTGKSVHAYVAVA